MHVIAGEILDVAVDLRASSPTFGKWHAVPLHSQEQKISGFPWDLRMDSGSSPALM